MNIFKPIKGLFLLATFCLMHAGSANAYIIDIKGYVNGNSNPVDVYLHEGTYEINPVGVAGGGDWNAWSAWDLTNTNRPICADPNGCQRTSPTTVVGWLNTYSFASADIVDVLIDGLPVANAVDGIYKVGPYMVYPDPLSALANAMTSQFTLTTSGTVSFMVPDSSFGNNLGGMSLHVVPEPSILALMALGLVGFGFTNRKKA